MKVYINLKTEEANLWLEKELKKRQFKTCVSKQVENAICILNIETINYYDRAIEIESHDSYSYRNHLLITTKDIEKFIVKPKES